MTWDLVDGLDAFALAAGDFLRRDPVAHTVVLGVLTQHAADVTDAGGPPILAVLRHAGEVAGVAWRTPPYPLGVTDVGADDARTLADLLVSARPDVASAPAVAGPAGSAEPLAARLAACLGRTYAPMLTETLYRLDGAGSIVADPRPAPPGRCRAATEADLPLLVDWLLAFVAEAGTTPPADAEARITGSIQDATMFVWDDGSVRAMAGGRPTGSGVARLGPVYTPPAARGSGVATALVAAACRHLFARGLAVVTLYADDDNPTSSGIYRRLGFRPVLSWVELSLV